MINLVGIRTPQITNYDFKKIRRKSKEWFSGCKIINGIYVINPLRIPYIKSEIINKINQIILHLYIIYYFKKLNVIRPIIWTLNVFYSELIKKIDNEAIIYYVSDDYAYFTGNETDIINKYENKTLLNSDGVITVSQRIFNRISKSHENVINIPNSTNYNHFSKINYRNVPEDLKILNKPIIGFSGKIEDWVDIELIKDCALHYPDYSFVLIGPQKINVDILKNIPNVFLLGRKTYNELPSYLNNIDVCLIPFVKNNVTEAVELPLKLLEYFAVGKPTVSINIHPPEKYSECLYICRTKEEFIKNIEKAITDDNEYIRKRRYQVAIENSWAKRAEEISDWITITILNN